MVPLMILVGVHVEHVLVGGAVALPLLTAVAVDAAVVAVIELCGNLGREAGRGPGTRDRPGADHGLALGDLRYGLKLGVMGLLAVLHQALNGGHCQRKNQQRISV